MISVQDILFAVSVLLLCRILIPVILCMWQSILECHLVGFRSRTLQSLICHVIDLCLFNTCTGWRYLGIFIKAVDTVSYSGSLLARLIMMIVALCRKMGGAYIIVKLDTVWRLWFLELFIIDSIRLHVFVSLACAVGLWA